MLNRAISSAFQPGSTFKIVSALAILQNKIADQNTKIRCKGYIKVGNRTFNCWKRSGHGYVDVKDAICQSCNVYFYKLGLQLKVEELVKIAQELGLGAQSFTGLKEEVMGVLPTKKYISDVLGQKWYPGDILNAAIGHGYMLATPFQLAVMTARVASGKVILPTFDNKSKNDFKNLDINPKNLQTVRAAMLDAINSPYGTSRRFASKLQKIAGKTGTAQVLNTENKRFGKIPDNALFIGYNASQGQKYAISVVLENAGTGGNAARVAVNVLDYLHSVNAINRAC